MNAGFTSERTTTSTTRGVLRLLAAALVCGAAVPLYVFLQRHFIRGMLTGAVKG